MGDHLLGVKLLLAALLVAVIFFGCVGIQSLERLHRGQQQLLESLRSRPAAVPAAPAVVPERSAAPAAALANARYFDAAAPVGGTLRQAIMAEPPGLNPLLTNESTSAALYGMCMASLAERNWEHPEEFEPLLAERWEISADFRHYHVWLRRGVLWQSFVDPDSGATVPAREVTAHDFKFFVDTVKNPGVNCAPYRSYYSDLERVEVLGDHEFIVHWRVSTYGSRASTLEMAPLPRHFYHNYPGPFDPERFNSDHRRSRMIVGCGPYRMVRWESDRELRFERNKEYFGNALGVGAKIETVIFEVIKLPNTQLQALFAGKLDMLNLSPDQWVRRANAPEFRDGRLRRCQYLLPSYTYIGYNQKNPLFGDRRVRQALTMLVDRAKIRRNVYMDLAEIVNGPFFPKSAYSDPGLKPWPYDPARARKLLAEAGWRDSDGDGILEKDGRKFVFTMMQIASSTMQQKMMPMIKESFAAAGIDMKLQNIEWSVYLQHLENRTYDACCLGWSSSFDPDMFQIWHSSQSAPGGSNHISYANAELDRLIETMRTTFDLPQRIRLAHRIGALLHEEQPYTFLFCPYSLVAASSHLRNVRVFPTGIPELICWDGRLAPEGTR